MAEKSFCRLKILTGFEIAGDMVVQCYRKMEFIDFSIKVMNITVKAVIYRIPKRYNISLNPQRFKPTKLNL